MKEKVGAFRDFQITRATYFHQTRHVLSIEEFLWCEYKNIALSIFVTEHFCSPFFAVQQQRELLE